MRRCFPFIGSLFLLFGAQYCAQVQPPSGGPKDTEPPKVVRAVPSNGTVEYDGQGFLLEFDEFVRTRRLQQELIISPPLENEPEILLDGKELSVQWEGDLDENRTYSFRFGSSIEDITEGNSVENLVYAFSTGPHLDSLHFEGRIVDARNMEGVEDVLAMLYREKADSVPRTQRPYYFARSDEQGHFDIPYLADGSYKFFALKDQNRNQRFDLPNEAIAFRKEPVRPYPADSSGDELFRLFMEESEEQFIKERKIEPGKTFFRFNRAVEEIELRTLEGAFPWDRIKMHRAGSDTATFWFPDREMPDSLDLVVELGGDPLDTVMVRNGSELWELDTGLALEKGFKDALDLYESPAFVTDHPLNELNPSRILTVSDSDTVDIGVHIGGKASRRLVLEDRKKFGSEISLTLMPGAVRDTFGRSNDSLHFTFPVREEGYYGTLRLLTKHREGKKPIILSLLDVQGNVVRRVVDSTGERFGFPYLDPGKYRIELILDRIPNGKWDPGKYPVRQPEPVRYYPDTLDVRSNWEQEIEWRGIGGE